jgi:hypothetical protein
MKFLTPLVIALISLSAVAQQQLPPLDPARQAERDARDRQNGQYDNRGNGPYDGNYGRNDQGQPPYITPGNRPPRPYRPQPRPPMPPPPSYNYDYGPAYTARWQDYGVTQVPKLTTQDINIDVRGNYVNEILLRSASGDVQVSSVLAYLSNGQVVDVRQASGYISDRREVRVQLDYRGSLRVERIVVRAGSPNLIGGRGQLSVILGLAY